MPRSHSHSSSTCEPTCGFSRAIRVGGRIDVAGTAPIPPEGEPTAATAHDQMLRCGEIMQAAIAELGGAAEDLIRTRMYITDPSDADAIGLAHKELFGEASPVATMVVVAALLDPSWKVETEAVAVVGGSSEGE